MIRFAPILLIFIGIAGCKKIEVPANHLKELFGKWRLIESSGPMGPCWPTDRSIWVEFRENGKQKIHENGKLTQTRRFVFEELERSSSQTFVLKFKDGSMQQFKISGDTLSLWAAGVSHGCMNQFVRR